MDAAAFVLDRPRATNAAELFGDRQAGLQSILMEAGAEVGAAEPHAALPAGSKTGCSYSSLRNRVSARGGRGGFKVTNRSSPGRP